MDHAAVGHPLAAALVLFLALVLCAPSALAFESLPPGDSVHDHVTADGARPLGWNGTGLNGLQQAVRAPDAAESKVKGSVGHLVVLDVVGDYEPSHHCDRLPPTPDAQVFAATSAYIRVEREEALQFARSNHSERAVAALGRALHALQDCHSHSDISEKDTTTQAQFQQALLTGGASPVGLRFTGFQPGDKDPVMPAGDPYPHGLYAKDATNSTPDAQARLPDGRTKFEAAASLAAATTRMFLEDFLGRLNATEKAAIMAMPPQHGNSSPIPGPSPVLGVALLGAALLARGRFAKRKDDAFNFP